LKVVTVISGKGGVGKTMLTANLGIALADSGYRVVLFDADLALANLDVYLGIRSDVKVQHAMDGKVSLRDAMVKGPSGVRVITGDSGVGKMIRLSRKRLDAFLENVSQIADDTDFLIYDAAAGADARVMTFARAADEVLLVVTPDPASVLDAFATAKVLFRSKPDASVRVLVNMAETPEQAWKVYCAVQSAIKQFIAKPVCYAGSVALHRRVAASTRSRKPFVLEMPHLQASKDIVAAANSLSVYTKSIPTQMVRPISTKGAPKRLKAA